MIYEILASFIKQRADNSSYKFSVHTFPEVKYKIVENYGHTISNYGFYTKNMLFHSCVKCNCCFSFKDYNFEKSQRIITLTSIICHINVTYLKNDQHLSLIGITFFTLNLYKLVTRKFVVRTGSLAYGGDYKKGCLHFKVV